MVGGNQWLKVISGWMYSVVEGYQWLDVISGWR